MKGINTNVVERNNLLKNRYGNQFLVFEKDNKFFLYSNLLKKCCYCWENWQLLEKGDTEDILDINYVCIDVSLGNDESYSYFENKYKKIFLASEYESFSYFFLEEVLKIEENQSTYTSWETKIESLMNSKDNEIFTINPINRLSQEEHNQLIEDINNGTSIYIDSVLKELEGGL